MQYMLVLNETSDAFQQRNDPAAAPAYWAAWSAYIGAMAAAGIVVNGDGLLPPDTATTVRVRDGKRQIEDGPFSDAKEQLAGYFIIEVPDLDAAIEWASKSPSAEYASVEIRPVLPPMRKPD